MCDVIIYVIWVTNNKPIYYWAGNQLFGVSTKGGIYKTTEDMAAGIMYQSFMKGKPVIILSFRKCKQFSMVDIAPFVSFYYLKVT